MLKSGSHSKLSIIRKEQMLDLSKSRPDIKRKDTKAKELTLKYSLLQTNGGGSSVIN